ncbi:glucose-6-phosphate dehydrogenase [Roseivirga sp. BDSF3-8]|uniref:glucose-6-phosphate dehydrogenase n=1 Tax=Roseivirga sp. BDSF3-8 TaxID=3241598 RepID=UPI003532699D
MSKSDNLALVIVGASGDLTARKLIPALYNLHIKNLLPSGFIVFGVGRSEYSDDSFRHRVVFENENLKDKEGDVQSFADRIFYESIEDYEKDSFGTVKDKLMSLNEAHELHENFIFYLSTPPSLYMTVPEHLAAHGLNDESNGWKRLVIEKPFGYDLESGRKLNEQLLKNYKEEQLYRIDHYLGKETVQNVLVTRFSNGIFEPIWNRNYINHVEITASESIGVEDRGGYYDNSGALRDMVQNHLLQLVALTAMEPPISADADSIRNEKVKLFKSLRPIKPEQVAEQVIRGQYLEATIKGEKAKSYREEKGVDRESRTETYLALKFFIDNWRWAGVPFYIRTGKRLPTRVTEIVLYFKPTPHHLFSKLNEVSSEANQLVIRIQPNEGILLKFGMKVPGAGFNVKYVNMDFHYADLEGEEVPDAYERLLLDCINGDPTLYSRGDAVNAAWEFVSPILKAWENDKDLPLYGYPSGTWGPEVADDLIEGKDLTWRYPCKNLTNDGGFCEL